MITSLLISALIGVQLAGSTPTVTQTDASPVLASPPTVPSAQPAPAQPTEPTVSHTLAGTLYAYSSTPDQTNGDPFITASGERVRSGIVANNCLPFGTQVEFNGQFYTVQDRMHSRYGCESFDVWFPSRAEAIQFGKQYTTVTVFEQNS